MKCQKIYFQMAVVALAFFLLCGCQKPIERSGVVVDSDTNKPLEGVEIDIYMKTQKRDSLKKNVITDENGYFLITEKRDTTQLFQLKKAGYLGLVNSLNTKGDTIKLERE